MSERPIILDGALGTELERRGFAARLPLWSAWALIEAPELVHTIHQDYIESGAQVVTACTFRTTRYTLAKVGMANRAEELTRLAVQLATPPYPPREQGGQTSFPPLTGGSRGVVVGGLSGGGIEESEAGSLHPSSLILHPVRVAASLAPLEDCYRPDLRPPDEVLLREHAHTARMLRDAGADLILVETQNSAREAQIATEMTLNMGLPVWTSLMPRSATEMFNGDSLADTALTCFALGVEAILVNCCPPDLAEAAFRTLREAVPPGEVKLGAYPNFRAPEGKPWDFSALLSPDEFTDWGQHMADLGADILGGCCGTTPEHIAALARKLRADN